MRISDWSSDVCSSDLEEQKDRAEDRARDEKLGRADPEYEVAELPQAAERQLEPDREEQQDDPQLAEERDVLGRADRDMLQPRIVRSEGAQPRRSAEQADEHEADDGREAEAPDRGDDNARRAEHHQQIGDASSSERGSPYG